MNVQDELAPASAATTPTTEPPLPSWEGASNEELMAIMNRGALAGDLFFSASAEMERRSKETVAALHAEEERVEAKRKHMALLIAALFALCTIIALKVTGRF